MSSAEGRVEDADKARRTFLVMTKLAPAYSLSALCATAPYAEIVTNSKR